MNESTVLRGIATISFYADDIPAAAQWYTRFLGIEPYFVLPVDGPPAYVEFRLGDFQQELGIIDRKYAPRGASAGTGGAVTYWHVDHIEAAFDKLKALGAKEYEPITSRGDSGFITASIVDPFGNILGIMYNPHYLEILDSLKRVSSTP